MGDRRFSQAPLFCPHCGLLLRAIWHRGDPAIKPVPGRKYTWWLTCTACGISTTVINAIVHPSEAEA